MSAHKFAISFKEQVLTDKQRSRLVANGKSVFHVELVRKTFPCWFIIFGYCCQLNSIKVVLRGEQDDIDGQNQN